MKQVGILDSYKLKYEEIEIDTKHIRTKWRNNRIDYKTILIRLWQILKLIVLDLIQFIKLLIRLTKQYVAYIKERHEINRLLNELTDPYFFIKAGNTK